MSRQINPFGNCPQRTTTGQGVPQVAQGMHTLQPNQYSHTKAVGRPSTGSPFTAPPSQKSIPSASMNDKFLESLMSAIGPVLTTHQQATFARIAQLEDSIQSLSNEMLNVRKEAQSQTKHVAQYLVKAHSVQQAATKTLTERVGRLEKVIGTSYDMDESKSLLNRMDTVSFAVEELLERTKDPHASLPDTTRYEVRTTPMRQIEEPQNREFTNIGVDPRTPEPSFTPRRFSSVAVEATLNEISFSTRPNSRGESSTGSSVPDATNEGNQLDPEQIQNNSNGTSALGPTRGEDDSLCNGSSHDIQTLRGDIQVQQEVAPIQADPASVPPVSDSPTPVDCTNEGAPFAVPPSASSGHGQESVSFAQPDLTLQSTEPYTIQGNSRDRSPDRNISSPRQGTPCDPAARQPDHTSPSPVSQFPPSASVSPVPSAALPASSAPSPAFTINSPPLNSAEMSNNNKATPRTTPATPNTEVHASSHPTEDGLAPPTSAHPDPVVKEEPLVAHSVIQPISAPAGLPSLMRSPASLAPSPKSVSALSLLPALSIPQTVVGSPSLSPLSSIGDEGPDIIMEDVKPQLQTPSRSQGTTSLRLKFAAGAEQSSAVTRIKKRKIKKQDAPLPEPPLKRTRRKVNKDKSGVDKQKRLAPDKLKRFAPVKQPKWPRKSNEDDAFLQKVVQCDCCLLWYHYGCVAIVPGDVRLENTEIFTCPPCVADANRLRPKSARGQKDICSRPDCDRNNATDEFFVSGIVGRTAKAEGSKRQRYLWLVKWDGYPIAEATWEDEGSMTDPQKLIEAFYETAKKEGLKRDDHSMIFLREAVDGGWHK